MLAALVAARTPGAAKELLRGYGTPPEQDTGADTARARAELGFSPATTLQQGLAAELEWVRERVPRAHSLTAS